MFEGTDFQLYEPHIDFAYTTLLMIWGGSLVGIGLLAVPLIFSRVESRNEASELTTAIFHRQDILIRAVVISMLAVFYFKSRLHYSYQYVEWGVYVIVLHFFIIGRIVSKRLRKMREKIGSFDEPGDKEPKRINFRRVHLVVRYLYIAQVIGVVMLLYLHAFGL
jgi:hydrogenase-4 membrane subunit HyfE